MLLHNRQDPKSLANKAEVVEKRNSKRWYLNRTIRVIDQETEQYLGDIKDISVSGIGMVCRFPMEPESTFELQIDLSDEAPAIDEIDLKVKSIWSEEKMVEHYWAGMKFENCSKDTVKRIKDLIFHFGCSS